MRTSHVHDLLQNPSLKLIWCQMDILILFHNPNLCLWCHQTHKLTAQLILSLVMSRHIGIQECADQCIWHETSNLLRVHWKPGSIRCSFYFLCPAYFACKIYLLWSFAQHDGYPWEVFLAWWICGGWLTRKTYGTSFRNASRVEIQVIALSFPMPLSPKSVVNKIIGGVQTLEEWKCNAEENLAWNYIYVANTKSVCVANTKPIYDCMRHLYYTLKTDVIVKRLNWSLEISLRKL